MLEWKTKRLVTQMKEFMDKNVKVEGVEAIKNMDANDLHMMQEGLALMESAYELAIEQAEALDDINRKLDKLLAKMEKES